MNLENSSINLVVYQGRNLSMYYVLGSIEHGRIEGSIKDDNKEVAQLTGIIRPVGHFFFRVEFYYAKNSFIDISGWIEEKSEITMVHLDDVEQMFLFEGKISERTLAKFSIMSLEEGVMGVTVSGKIK